METLWHLVDSALGLSANKPELLSTPQVCARAFVVFIVLLFYVRVGKKRFLGQATGFDVIIVIVVGSVASRGISGTAPFIPTLAGAFTLIATHWVISYLTRSSKLLSYIIKGHDTVLIRDGHVDKDALRSQHMSEDDLGEDLRQAGIETPAEVKVGRLERSGRFSVIKADKRSPQR